MIGAHHLQSLCMPTHVAGTNKPFRIGANSVAATNGQAALIVEGVAIDAPELPAWASIAELKWRYAGATHTDRLRAFVRRKPGREREAGPTSIADVTETVDIFGAGVDAVLLRRFLPGTHETVRIHLAINDCRRHWLGVKVPAIRIDGANWKLIVMGMARPDAREVFEP